MFEDAIIIKLDSTIFRLKGTTIRFRWHHQVRWYNHHQVRQYNHYHQVRLTIIIRSDDTIIKLNSMIIRLEDTIIITLYSTIISGLVSSKTGTWMACSGHQFSSALSTLYPNAPTCSCTLDSFFLPRYCRPIFSVVGHVLFRLCSIVDHVLC